MKRFLESDSKKKSEKAKNKTLKEKGIWGEVGEKKDFKKSHWMFQWKYFLLQVFFFPEF